LAAGLRRELGEHVVPLFAQGAGASVMPHRGPDDRTPEAWARVAHAIAAFVQDGDLREVHLDLVASEREFDIPYDLARMPSAEELLDAYDRPDDELAEGIRPANPTIYRLWAAEMIERLRTGTVPTGFRMHASRIQLDGGTQVITLSGEVTAEVGRLVKSVWPDRDTVMLGYCSYTDAYIPTAAMIDEGGFEPLTTIYFHSRPAPFVHDVDAILRREVQAL